MCHSYRRSQNLWYVTVNLHSDEVFGGYVCVLMHYRTTAQQGFVNCYTADIDLKAATKAFSSHFSCGSSVTGDDEVVIQGDVCDNLIDFIQTHWPEVREFCFKTSANHCSKLVTQVEEECIERVVTKRSKK